VVDSLSADSEHVLAIAVREAAGLHHEFTGTEHILLGLIACDDDIAAPLLGKHGVVAVEVRAQVARPPSGADTASEPSQPLTARAKQVLTLAGREAYELDDTEVRPEHLLLGIIRQASGVAALVLRDMGVDLAELREEILEARLVRDGLFEEADNAVAGRRIDSEIAGAPSSQVVRVDTLDRTAEKAAVPRLEMVPPLCPSCGQRLTEVLATANVAPEGSNTSGRRRSPDLVTLIYCGACGHTLSAIR
jgi:ATP-dependent Clp protease ATP-binding subunit ClpA